MTLSKSITVGILLFNTVMLSYGPATAANSGMEHMTGPRAAATLNKQIQQNNGGAGKNGDVQSSCTVYDNTHGCDAFLKVCKKYGGGISTEPGGYGCHVVLPSHAGVKNDLKALE